MTQSTNSRYTPGAQSLVDALSQRILVLDGAMGTMIQRFGLTETDFRPAGHAARVIMQGCNDILTITRPDIIHDIHRQYVEAGADIIETCTFNSNALSLDEYALTDRVAEINRAAVRLAREVADSAGRQVWVAGSMGPTGKSLTMAVNLGDSITFDDMEQAYFDQAKALVEGGVDLLLIETIFDTLNAKAAIHAAQRAMDMLGVRVPLMLSVTLSENGRTLSGQSLDAFIVSIAHAEPLIVSLNCGFGPESMSRYVEQLQYVPYAVAMYPNAGLPNKMGQYDQDPETMGRVIEPLLSSRRLNIVGGCCGTTPDHIRLLASIAAGCQPREVPAPVHETRLAGLEPLVVNRASNLVNIGERCNVAGSRKFLRLIKEGAIQEALEIASGQVANGAQAVDVNMDDGMLDAAECMSSFVARLQVEPDVAVVPMVIDSSKSDVIMAGLKRVQGKPLVNSISLKEGEEAFINMARAIHRLGAAMVVMAFDEQGQATTLQRRVEICTRAYTILTEKVGISPHDIVFDPNILTIATGMPEHDTYAIDFINAVRIIKETLPGAKTCGGVSNLSFAFRGNNYLREAMHAVFLYHAVAAGLDMAIVNAASLMAVDDIEPQLREAIEDLLFMRRPDAVDRLTQLAAELKDAHSGEVNTPSETETLDPEKRLENLIIKGSALNLEEVINEVSRRYDRVADLIDGPLMSAMDTVGRLFGEGRLFLPQVVKSAGVMKNAVAILEPRLEQERTDSTAGSSRRCMVLATVKGDVHDIGKNIVAVIMKCNGWNVVDLGVMVPPDKIIDAVIEHNADAVGLSGLITPSLDEMCRVARMMQERGIMIPLFIGGATTSARHTAVKIAPCREGVTVYTRDAARVPVIASRLVSAATAQAEAQAIRAGQEAERDASDNAGLRLLTLDEARRRAVVLPHHSTIGNRCAVGVNEYEFAPSQLRNLINIKALLFAWKLDPALPQAPEARKLTDSMCQLLDRLETTGYRVRARAVTMAAAVDRATDTLTLGACCLPMLRSQVPDADGHTMSVVDFVNPDGSDVVTAFAVTAPDIDANSADEYDKLLGQSVAHRLVEAATELLHRTLSTPDATGKTGIRPAVGYAMMPDQSLVFELDKLLKYKELDIKLTEHGALHPSATTTGIVIYNPSARYFDVGPIDETQLEDYAARRASDLQTMRGFLASVL
ncbi:MAG: methionine synthase [Muribaculaceae bacterium]|nr:methionine synthase [Muribaculaceae bacterium]